MTPGAWRWGLPGWPHSMRGPVPLLGGPFPGAPPPSTHASLGGLPSSRGSVSGPSPPRAPQGSELAPGGGTGDHLNKKNHRMKCLLSLGIYKFKVAVAPPSKPRACSRKMWDWLLPKKGQAGRAWASCLGVGEGDTPSVPKETGASCSTDAKMWRRGLSCPNPRSSRLAPPVEGLEVRPGQVQACSCSSQLLQLGLLAPRPQPTQGPTQASSLARLRSAGGALSAPAALKPHPPAHRQKAHSRAGRMPAEA